MGLYINGQFYGKSSACACSRYQAFPPGRIIEGLETRTRLLLGKILQISCNSWKWRPIPYLICETEPVYDTTQILSEKREWKRSSRLYYEYHYLHAAQSIFMSWLTTSYSNLSHLIRILPYNKSARAGSNSYHRSVYYFFYDFDTLVLKLSARYRDSIPKLFIALHGRNLILEYGRSNIAGTK